MITNTFTPHVGGVARSVESFVKEYRRQGHHVLVVAPEFDKMPAKETNVIRIPAIQRFNGSDFSVRLPMFTDLSAALSKFKPDVVHSHHPFLLGDTAVRVANKCHVPLVFTHHTMYEQYTHYVPGDSQIMKRFAIKLSVGYCNLCDHVITPSESIEKLLKERGVKSPISAIPTGVPLDRFSKGSGRGFRGVFDLPRDAFIVGHVGRLAPEKNLEFLSRAVAKFMHEEPNAIFMVVGSGPSSRKIEAVFKDENLSERLFMMGSMEGKVLVSAFKAMDVFAFSSLSETQGMVMMEAMASQVPVVALDAPGAREVVKDGENGRLLKEQNIDSFVEALRWVASKSANERRALRRAALKTGREFSMERCAKRVLDLYQSLAPKDIAKRREEESYWSSIVETIQTEWNLLSNVAEAAGSAISEPELTEKPA